MTTRIKLEVGKKYRTRDGLRVYEVLSKCDRNGYDFYVKDHEDGCTETYMVDGTYDRTDPCNSSLDLVSEIQDNAYTILEAGSTGTPINATEAPTEGVARKYDSSKVQLELLSVPAMMAIGEVMTFGARKYEAHNWRKGFQWSRLLGAALRHLMAYMAGEDKDPESGLSHLAHAGCCVMFLLEHEICKLGRDDRYVISKKE